MVGIFILNIVLLATIKWRPEALSNPDSMSNSDFAIVIFVLFALLLLLMIAFHFNIQSTWTLRKLYDVRRNINTERNRMYVRRLFEHVKKGEFPEAIEIHNNLVFGQVKTLTRGVLIGALYYKGDEEGHKKAIKNMDGIVDEEM